MQEIHHLAHQLKDRGVSCTLHWLPSHIENTFGRKRYTGNYYADKLAIEGQALSTVTDERFQPEFVREQILSAVIYLVEAIEKRLELLNNPPDGPPAHADDLSACTDAERDPGNRIPRQFRPAGAGTELS